MSRDRRPPSLRQRLILCLLLAFCIDTLRPSIHVTAHRHPGADRPHVHPDEILGSASDAGAAGARGTGSLLAGAGLAPPPVKAPARRPQIRSACSDALHAHLVQPLLRVARITALGLPAPLFSAIPCPGARPAATRPAPSSPGQARSPPSLPA